MEFLMKAVEFLKLNHSVLIEALLGLLGGVIAIALLIPGPEPETTLQKFVDFLKKFSKKKSD